MQAESEGAVKLAGERDEAAKAAHAAVVRREDPQAAELSKKIGRIAGTQFQMLHKDDICSNRVGGQTLVNEITEHERGKGAPRGAITEQVRRTLLQIVGTTGPNILFFKICLDVISLRFAFASSMSSALPRSVPGR